MYTQEILCKLIDGLKQSPDEDAQAAVAIIVHPGKGDLEVFLVKRAEVHGDPWSGDMAFPGGKRVARDKTLLDTVTREVWEETSIDLTDQEVLGYVDPIYSWVKRDLAVQPILFSLDEKPKFKLNYELSNALWVNLGELINTKQQSMVKGGETPIFSIGEDLVWGLTYRMIERISEIIKS